MERFIDDPVARHLFAEAQEGIAIFDETGTLIAWNAASRAITGWDQAAAATQGLLARGAGMIQIREGKWVDLRSTAVATPERALRIVLFADASAQVALTEARRHLTEGGLIDQVTRLPSMPIALGHLERAVALGRRDERAVGVLAVAVDLPDVGPDAPTDEVMGQLGKRVITATRTSDLAARVGASELRIVLTAMASAVDAAVVAVRLLLQLSQPYVVSGRERSATVSVGVASYPADGDSADAVRAAARDAMTRVRSGGGGYQLASPTTGAETLPRCVTAARVNSAGSAVPSRSEGGGPMLVRVIPPRTLRYALVAALAFGIGAAGTAAAAKPLDLFRLADATDDTRLARVDASGNVAVTVSNLPTTLQVAGTVNVGNSPTVQAQQSGVWSVAVSGTPTVGIDPSANTVQLSNTSISANVTSSENSPIFTRDVDNAARHPFQIKQSRFDVNGFLSNSFTVPAGQTLVIEYVTADMGAPVGAIMAFSLITTANGIQVQHLIPVTQRDRFPALTTDNAIATASLRAYADAGSTVQVTGCIFCGNGGSLTGYSAQFVTTVSGYLVKN